MSKNCNDCIHHTIKHVDINYCKFYEVAIGCPSITCDSYEEYKTSVKDDMVNHPSHYTSGSIEVIDFIEDKEFNYNLGNSIKYISRCNLKGTKKQDLEKAIWYIKREIGGMKDE